MRKRVISIILLSSVLLGSTAGYVEGSERSSIEIVNTEGRCDDRSWYIEGEPAFPVTPDKEQWKEFRTHSQMVEACILPESLLNKLSIKELVKLMLDYPLLGDLMLYDDIDTGIDIMSEECNILSEIMNREDGAEELLNAYCDLKIEEKSLIPKEIANTVQSNRTKGMLHIYAASSSCTAIYTFGINI